MNNSHRYLTLTKTQVKTLFKTPAIDFATDKEKEKFKHFNVRYWYLIDDYDLLKPFGSYEKAEKYISENSAFEGSTISQKFVLLMK